ncbi:DUF397 domain-containing protein [Streptomyces sp. MS19]|uniref:DUF397 domain-containing protein n=1 Tax=Streptomyces sp. MS19 TaxID=3385972 RepID=UPI00399FAD2A
MMHPAPSAAELAVAAWYKSSATNANNECVEVAHFPDWTGIRDTKQAATPDRPVVLVPATAFTRLITHIRQG